MLFLFALLILLTLLQPLRYFPFSILSYKLFELFFCFTLESEKDHHTSYHIYTAKRQLNVVAQSCHMSTRASLLFMSYSISLQGNERNQSQTYVDAQLERRHSVLSAHHTNES